MIHALYLQSARPGHLPALSKRFASEELALRREGPGVFRGAWTSEFGALNKLYALFEYEDVAQQAQADAALYASAAWRAHAQSMEPMLSSAKTMLLDPVRPIQRPPDDSAFYDFRLYDVKPYCAQEYARLLHDVLPVRELHSKNFCIWRPVAGHVHRIVHLWPYDSLEQRTSVREKVAAEPAWKEFVGKVFPLLVRQRSSLLRPVKGLA